MDKNLDYYMSLPYRAEVLPDQEEGGYALRCPELPGCLTCAETLEDGLPVPEPVCAGDFSGQFKLRMPKSLHWRLAQRSREEGVSMNQYCVYLLSKGV